jgi:Fur family ferric uptake transcriptional regulator
MTTGSPASAGPAVRQTRQRAAVVALLTGLEEFRSAQQLHDLLRASGASVGLTTVYRCLQSMAGAGEVDLLVNDDGETLYRKCSTEHHHHLVCRRCGTTVEIAGADAESWADRVAAEHGFVDVSHTIEISGLCATCGSTPRRFG